MTWQLSLQQTLILVHYDREFTFGSIEGGEVDRVQDVFPSCLVIGQ